MVHEMDFVLWVFQHQAYKAEKEGGQNHFCIPNYDTNVLCHLPQTAGVWKYWDFFTVALSQGVSVLFSPILNFKTLHTLTKCVL